MYHYKIIITTQTNIMSNIIENKIMLLTPLVRHSPFMNSEEANIYIAMLEKTLNNVKMLEMKTNEAKIQLRKIEIEVDTIKLNLKNIIPKKRKTNDYDTSIEKMIEAAINVRMTELKAIGAIAEANSVITEIENLLVMKAETKAGAEARAEVEAEAKAGDEDKNAEVKAREEAEAKARKEAEAKSSVEAEANTRAKKKARVEAEANTRAIEVRASLAKAWTEANARDEAIRKNNETVVDNEIEMSTTPFPSTAYKCDELYIEEKRKRLIKRHISRYRQNPTYKDLWKINLNLVKEFIDKNKTSPKGEFAKWISNQTTNFITNKNMMEDTEIKELWKNFIENYNLDILLPNP
jgi:colicin import membrane protein